MYACNNTIQYNSRTQSRKSSVAEHRQVNLCYQRSIKMSKDTFIYVNSKRSTYEHDYKPMTWLKCD